MVLQLVQSDGYQDPPDVAALLRVVAAGLSIGEKTSLV
jgi:hypothetical protein